MVVVGNLKHQLELAGFRGPKRVPPAGAAPFAYRRIIASNPARNCLRAVHKEPKGGRLIAGSYRKPFGNRVGELHAQREGSVPAPLHRSRPELLSVPGPGYIVGVSAVEIDLVGTEQLMRKGNATPHPAQRSPKGTRRRTQDPRHRKKQTASQPPRWLRTKQRGGYKRQAGAISVFGACVFALSPGRGCGQENASPGRLPRRGGGAVPRSPHSRARRSAVSRRPGSLRGAGRGCGVRSEESVEPGGGGGRRGAPAAGRAGPAPRAGEEFSGAPGPPRRGDGARPESGVEVAGVREGRGGRRPGRVAGEFGAGGAA